MFELSMIERKGFTWAVILLAILSMSACGGGVVGDSNNYFIVKDQTLINLDEITIESVSLDQNAIIVLYSASVVSDNSKSNNIVGFKALSEGEYENIVIRLDSIASNNQTFFAELRADNGNIGELELNGIDTLITQSATSSVSFGVVYSSVPYLSAFVNNENQYVTSNIEEIVLKKVISAEPTWLVIFRNDEGELGAEMGYQFLDAGHYSKVAIRINPRQQLMNEQSVIVKMYKDVDKLTTQFDSISDELITGENTSQTFDVIVQPR